MCCTQATQFPPKQVPFDYNATPPRTFAQSFIAIRYLKHHILHDMHLCYWYFLGPGLSLGAPTIRRPGGFKTSNVAGLRGEHVASIPSRFPGSSRWAPAQSL
jgi:hypothetical protein